MYLSIFSLVLYTGALQDVIPKPLPAFWPDFKGLDKSYDIKSMAFVSISFFGNKTTMCQYSLEEIESNEKEHLEEKKKFILGLKAILT